MADRASLIAKIQALLAKTVGNGCTEAEAIAALELARKLMDQHDVGDTDLAFGGEQAGIEARRVSDRDRIRNRLHVAVGRFCGCRAWQGTFEELVYCGLVSKTIFAHWLLDTLADFVARELQTYLARTPGVGRVRRRETEAFVEGCCARLCERLEELTPAASELMALRDQLIEEKMATAGITLSRGRGRFRLLDGRAHGAGVAAGDQAQFNRPMGGRHLSGLLGRR